MSNFTKKIISYGDNCQQYGQLFKPEPLSDAPLPVVIVIHGGYWKDNHSLDTYATTAVVDYLKTFNVAIWNLEYRRMEASGENKKAPWPAVFHDISMGIDHIATIAEQEGLDLSRVFAIGHSAGGHLAVWAGCRKNIPRTSILYKNQPLRIHSVMSIAGILDLSLCDDIEQPEQVHRLMGGTAQQHPERFQACDPNLLHSSDIDITIVHGSKDGCVKVSQAERYCANAKANVEQAFIKHADHFSMLPHQGIWHVDQWQLIKDKIANKISALS